MKNIYQEKLEIGVYYSYNDKREKVYDIKGMREQFKELIKKIK
jgi:hypothetical protein|tara:strand:- start:1109 stop:1237 length:129 start_codon:yes stop_codon:yes gene_type:complete